MLTALAGSDLRPTLRQGDPVGVSGGGPALQPLALDIASRVMCCGPGGWWSSSLGREARSRGATGPARGRSLASRVPLRLLKPTALRRCAMAPAPRWMQRSPYVTETRKTRGMDGGAIRVLPRAFRPEPCRFVGLVALCPVSTRTLCFYICWAPMRHLTAQTILRSFFLHS